MARVKVITIGAGEYYGVSILCPACLWSDGRPQRHVLKTKWTPAGFVRSLDADKGDQWDFNGDLDRPVFTPSLRCWYGSSDDVDGIYNNCHSFIGHNGALPGQIIFLSDCTHALAGQVRDLPEIDE